MLSLLFYTEPLVCPKEPMMLTLEEDSLEISVTYDILPEASCTPSSGSTLTVGQHPVVCTRGSDRCRFDIFVEGRPM